MSKKKPLPRTERVDIRITSVQRKALDRLAEKRRETLTNCLMGLVERASKREGCWPKKKDRASAS